MLVVGDDVAVASLAARDLKELTAAEVRVLQGGTRACREAGLPVESSSIPHDADRVDYLFWQCESHARAVSPPLRQHAPRADYAASGRQSGAPALDKALGRGQHACAGEWAPHADNR